MKQLREQVRGLQKEYNKTEDDLKALQVRGCVTFGWVCACVGGGVSCRLRLGPVKWSIPHMASHHKPSTGPPNKSTTNPVTQSVGQIIGDVLKQLDEERFIVKASSGPRYVVRRYFS